LNEFGEFNQGELEDNLRQLNGAWRQLFDLKTPIELGNPKRRKEKFDPSIITEIYLISVLFGKPPNYLVFAESIKTYQVHVFSQRFTEIVLNELDTVTDFVHYLGEKQNLLTQDRNIHVIGGEEELLVIYLQDGRSFGELLEYDDIHTTGGIWQQHTAKPEYLAKKRADEISYLVDHLIEIIHDGEVKEYEIVARELARLNRYKRRLLANALYEGRIKALNGTGSLLRRLVPLDGVTICLLYQDKTDNTGKGRQNRLSMMCFVARGLHRANEKVIGIATDKTLSDVDSYDFCLVNIADWTDEMQRWMERIQEETGMFKNFERTHTSEDEYPIN